MTEFCMPSLGADMKEATLIEWKVKPGDRVKRGDIIAEVETDKGIIEIEVFEDGVVEQILVQPGTKVAVGTVLAIIRPEGEESSKTAGKEKGIIDTKSPPETGLEKEETEKPAPEVKVCATPGTTEKRIRISPLARKVAADLGIDLSMVHGTGHNGAISRADVDLAAKQRDAQKKSLPLQKIKKETKKTDFQAGMRKAIAMAMSRSNREIPHYYLETRIDMTKSLGWLEEQNRKRSIRERILPVVLLIKGVALALGDVPELNGYWTDDHHQPQEAIHIGFAISLRQGGLVTPAIHNADLMSLDEIMEALRDLIIRTRAGRLRSSEMTDATITLTSLGDLGVEKVYGVIYPPQVALVGFGRIMEQPWAENGMLGIRQILTATLAGDHRATDGHRGAQFLDAVNHYLQEPTKL